MGQKRWLRPMSNIWCSVGIHPHRAGSEPDAANVDAIFASADHQMRRHWRKQVLITFMIMRHRNNKKIVSGHKLQLPDIWICQLSFMRAMRTTMWRPFWRMKWKRASFRGVLHCFSSGAELAERAIDIGFYISFSGILTFKKAEKSCARLQRFSPNRILVETDLTLSSVPHRGRPNEPAYTVHTLEKLATIRGKRPTEMAHITSTNTLRLFNRMIVS